LAPGMRDRCLGRRDSHADQGAVATQFSSSTGPGTSPAAHRLSFDVKLAVNVATRNPSYGRRDVSGAPPTPKNSGAGLTTASSISHYGEAKPGRFGFAMLDGEACAGVDTRGSTQSFEERGRIGGDTSFMAFELLTVKLQDVMREPWRDRRKRLEDLFTALRVGLVPVTEDATTHCATVGWAVRASS
jgi:hypothetical protein